MLKYRKVMLIGVGIILLIIILIVTISLVKSKKKKNNIEKENPKVEIDTNQLETDFKNLFNNEGNEIVKTLYDINVEDSGKYDIIAKIPYAQINDNIDGIINKKIHDIFVKTLLSIYDNSEQNTRLEISYTCSMNNDYISIIIKCIFKNGSNPQRTIIKTFNYSLTDYSEISVIDILSKEKQEKLQKEVYDRIEAEIEKENRRSELGYSSYKRDLHSDIYLIENASEFFIKDNILYIIYSYGNSSYTSTMDIIITEIS